MKKDEQRIAIADARICRDCSNLITADQYCPMCGEATEPSEHRTDTEGYCYECAGGPFPANKLHVVTWNENPYDQMEDGDLATVCLKCMKGDA